MDYGMIGKIKKANEYAQQLDRIEMSSFSVTFQGTNNSHEVSYDDGQWQCDCDFFQTRGHCSHTMALEKVLVGLLPD